VASEKNLFIQSFTAASDLTAATAQYAFVKQVTNGNVIACAAATDIPIGVLQNLPSQGQLAEVALFGISKVRVGGTDITSVTNPLVTIDAAGRAVLLTPGTGASTASYCLGRILTVPLEGTDNDGALVTCAINCINLGRSL
jgi:hypothetical protein